MQWFYNLKIATKLIISFLLVLVLTAGIGIFSIDKLADVNATSTEIQENWMPAMRAAQGMRFLAAEYRLREAQHILAQSTAEMRTLEQGMEALLQEFEQRRVIYEALIASPEERELYQDMLGYWAEYRKQSDNLLGISRQMMTEQAQDFFNNESLQVFDTLATSLRQLVQLNNDGADVASEHGDELYT